MMLRKIEMREYERIKKLNSRIYAEVDGFLSSGDPVCEVVVDEYASPTVAYNSYRVCVKRMMNGVKVTKVGDRVFLLAPKA